MRLRFEFLHDFGDWSMAVAKDRLHDSTQFVALNRHHADTASITQRQDRAQTLIGAGFPDFRRPFTAGKLGEQNFRIPPIAMLFKSRKRHVPMVPRFAIERKKKIAFTLLTTNPVPSNDDLVNRFRSIRPLSANCSDAMAEGSQPEQTSRDGNLSCRAPHFPGDSASLFSRRRRC